MAGGSTSTAVDRPAWHSIVGLTLACCAGFFVGLSLILQKKGLMMTKETNLKLEKKVSHLTNPVWWMGMLSSNVN